MKTFITVIFAGAIVASGSFAASNDAGAEARFRAKWGRGSPAQEASHTANREAPLDCAERGCCHRKTGATLQSADPSADERFRAKWGRSAPVEEARQEADTALAAHCARSEAAGPIAAARNDNGAEERFQSKFGRSSPVKDVRVKAAKTGGATHPVLIASADCPYECCKHN